MKVDPHSALTQYKRYLTPQLLSVSIFREAIAYLGEYEIMQKKQCPPSTFALLGAHNFFSAKFCACVPLIKICFSFVSDVDHTAETQSENSKQIFPEKELRRYSLNSYIHVSVSDLYILLIGLPILLQEYRWTERAKEYIIG